jgi:transposase
MPGRLGRRDNPVRVIDVLVDELELGDLGFSGTDPEATGRPSYHPSVLPKFYIYGYLNRVQSSRRLEREATRNVEVMWLTGRLMPDHKTIADNRDKNFTRSKVEQRRRSSKRAWRAIRASSTRPTAMSRPRPLRRRRSG